MCTPRVSSEEVCKMGPNHIIGPTTLKEQESWSAGIFQAPSRSSELSRIICTYSFPVLDKFRSYEMLAQNSSKRIGRFVVCMLSITLLGLMLSTAASAQAWNKKTTVTFSGPVEIPGVGGQVLPAG